MSSQTASRPGKITDRISIFEQKQSPASQGNVSLGSVPSKHYPAKRTLSSKNVNVLKSQFDTSGENRKISPAESITTIQETSPPPPPPPRTLPPESPPQVPKRTSVTSKPAKKPTVSPTSSGKSSPTDRGGGGPTKTTTTPGRRSPPGSKTVLNKSTPVSSKTGTPTKKKLVSTNPSPTAPIPKNVNGSNKKVASRTTSSPISPPAQPQSTISSLEKSNNSVSAATTTPVPTSKMTSSNSTVKKASLIQNTNTPTSVLNDQKNNNNNSKISEVNSLTVAVDSNNHVPIVEVSLENAPSATSTPNLNSKKSLTTPASELTVTTTMERPDITENLIEHSVKSPDLVVNKNFINEAVTGSRYWSNQALQNDNSTKISQVVRIPIYFHF